MTAEQVVVLTTEDGGAAWNFDRDVFDNIAQARTFVRSFRTRFQAKHHELPTYGKHFKVRIERTVSEQEVLEA